MNLHEKLLVSRLVTSLMQEPDGPKDPEALLELEALVKARPDAPYLLLRRAVALEAALAQIRQSVDQAGPRAASLPAATGAPTADAVPAASVAWPSAGSFLGTAAAVGAGVAAGSLLAEGVRSLIAGDDASSGFFGAGTESGPATLAAAAESVTADDELGWGDWI